MNRKYLKSIIFIVEKVIFSKEGSDAVILAVRDDEGKARRVKGDLADVTVGSVVSATGRWRQHETYGWQFVADEMRTLCADPMSEDRDRIICRVSDVKELRAETSFGCAHGTDPEDKRVRLSGRILNMKPGRDVFALGEWSDDPKYGKEFRVKQWEFLSDSRPGMLWRAMEMADKVRAEKTADDSIRKIGWEDIEIRDDAVMVPNHILGRRSYCPFPGARAAYDSLRTLFAARLPKLEVSYSEDGHVTILNPTVLRDAVSVMHVQHRIHFEDIRTAQDADVIREVSEMAPSASKVFVPRDMTPYLDFLQEKQADVFNVVPIVELIDGSKEDAFLFTVLIGDRPCIVWENVNDARATFVFRCDETDYDERLQLVYDFAAADKSRKRRFLHSDASASMFGEKPVCLVHNTLASWTERLMAL